jgi:hypothetical protein
MEQNRKPRNKSMQFQPFDFCQRNPKHMLEKKIAFSKIVSGQSLVAYSCNPSCSAGRDQEDHDLKPA